jgi:hypothetical protein
MIIDLAIILAKAALVIVMVLNLAGVLGWVERKGSALIQDRIGANRASILGFAGMNSSQKRISFHLAGTGFCIHLPLVSLFSLHWSPSLSSPLGTF